LLYDSASEKILTHIAYIHSETKVKRDMFDLTSNQRQVKRAHVGCTGAQKALSSRPHEADTEPCFYLLNAQDIFQIYTGVVQQFSTRILIEHPFLTTLMDRNKENTARDS
jgi:hypothetical protein